MAGNPKTTVFLVDDHPMLRRGIAECINSEPDLQVCGEAGSATEAVAGVARLQPDVVLVDISMPGRDGIELLKDLRAQGTTARLLVFSMHDESLYALRALRAGASGYVMKSESEQRLLDAIRAVRAGRLVVSDRLDNMLLSQAIGLAPGDAPEPLSKITDRELQILRMIGDGCPRKQIAAELRLSVKTIESHRKNICQKLGLSGSDDLLRFAAAHVAREARTGGGATAEKATPRARKAGSRSAKNT